MNTQVLSSISRRPRKPESCCSSMTNSKPVKSAYLLSIILLLATLLLTTFAQAAYEDYDYIDIGAPIKELIQENISAQLLGATINKHGDVIFYLRDNANPLLDIYQYHSESGTLQALDVTIPEGSYFDPQTFDINDNGLIIFGQVTSSPYQLLVRALTPAGALETRMTVLNNNTILPFNINNHDQMVARTYSSTLGHHLMLVDGPDVRTQQVPFDSVTQTMTNINPVIGDTGDSLYIHNMRYGGIEFNWYNIATDSLDQMLLPELRGVYGVDGVNENELAVVTAIKSDGVTETVFVQSGSQSVPILETNAEYQLFRNPAKINNHNQLLVTTYTQTSRFRLMIVEPEVSASGEILGPPIVEPTLVFENSDGIYPMTNDGKVLLRAILDTSNNNKVDFNDRGEVVFRGQVCETLNFQDCYSSMILARPKAMSPENLAPTANAGADQAIRAGDSVQLDGSGSFDDNTPSDQLGYFWTVVMVPDGSSVTQVSGSETVHPTLQTDLPGVYKVRLQVSDEQGLVSNYDEVIISTENLLPTANAGPDALVLVDTHVILDGQDSSDPESDPLNYQWQLQSIPANSAVALDGAETAIASFIADKEGDYVVRLTVSDPLGAGIPDSVTITAIRPDDFAKMAVIKANNILIGLEPHQVTTKGNQKALSKLMRQVITTLNGECAIEEPIAKLYSAIRRVDGCTLRGEPDSKGKERDWIIDCEVQKEVYAELDAALQSLLQVP